jgi:chemosensory pili system protein ChpE
MDLTSGLILAFAYVAAPGPIIVETLRRGVSGGFAGSLAVQTGSAIGIITYAGLALMGAGLAPQTSLWQLAVGAAGVIMLLYLGIVTIRTGRTLTLRPAQVSTGRAATRGAFWTGAALSLANPLDIVFWLSIGSRAMAGNDSPGHPFFTGFLLGCVLTSLGVAAIAGFCRSRLAGKPALAVSWVCGLALIGFGLRLGVSLVREVML